jgi:hypothetical protein
MTDRMLAVVHNGAAEREVSSREEAFAFARECGAASVDLWTAPKPARDWRWSKRFPKLFDDGAKPIKFDVPVPERKGDA